MLSGSTIERPEQRFQEAYPTVDDFVSYSNDVLAGVDPLVMNLVIAKGIPSLVNLDVGRYVSMADQWAAEIKRYLPQGDANFYSQPELWKNDLDFSRLALMHWYIESVLGIRYREDQRNAKHVVYTDPTDLFLNGVMDTRQGTCGTMAALYVVLGRRLGWPLHLACVQSHFICRFDDGNKIINVEASTSGDGHGFSSPPDEYYLKEYNLPQKAVDCGSDLRSLSPREMLGAFVGLRARHLENTNRLPEAEPDYLLARYLFPRNRNLYIAQNQTSVQCSMDLFEPHEKGHPMELACWLQQVVQIAPWKRKEIAVPPKPRNPSHVSHVDEIFQKISFGRDWFEF